jgi:adenosylmethionine-8-amino-7-oxononanoate aminotransferase
MSGPVTTTSELLSQPAPRPRLFPRDVTRSLRKIVRAEGIRLWDSDGNEFIDADSGAISVISIGHGVEEVVEAMAEQARRLAYVHNGQFLHDVGEELAEALARFAPGDLNRSILVSGGSEATETAVKLARQYHLVRGNPDKTVVVSRERSYHGATLAALSLSGVPVRQAPYAPYLRDEPKALAAYCYRCPLGLEYPGCDVACATDLERIVQEVGPERVSAFIAEPIVAAAGAGMTPPEGYFARIRDICDRHDILFIADEVVTGFGRTGTNFGIEHWSVLPDVIVTAKGLAGGYAPLAAVLFTDRVADTFESRGISFTHGLTWEAHPVACAAGLAVLGIIERDGLVANAARHGEHLFSRLRQLGDREPIIGDLRGRGLLAGIELVADRESKRPFAPELQLTRRVCDAAEARGLMIYPGAADGVVGDQLIISPPLVVSSEDIDLIVDRFAAALADAQA